MTVTLSEWWNQKAACELLQKARLNPEDITPRTVLADWLEEHAQSFSNPFMEKLASVLRASFKRKTLRMIPKKDMSDDQPFVGALNGWFVGRECVYSGETSRLWIMALDSFEISTDIWLELMPIKPGSFKMGSPPDEYGRSEDEILHEVSLSKPFYIGKFPITQKQWRAVMGNDTGIGYSAWNPIESISFYEAIDFCQRLNQILASKLNGKKFRLPTEAEWEYACRAGTHTPFSFGNTCDGSQAMCWCYYNDGGTYPPSEKPGAYAYSMASVGSFQPYNYSGYHWLDDYDDCVYGKIVPNPWGLFDMHGNVGEWCQDWYGQYPSRKGVNPKGPKSGEDKVVRGGSYKDGARSARSAARWYQSPSNSSKLVGLRVVLA